MKHRALLLSLVLIFAVLSDSHPALAEDNASVEMFSPQGEVKGVRQVTARFSEQMVAFGDPRLLEPFDIKCTEKGYARWVDGKTWIYDFDRDLPAGIVCEFDVKPDLKTLSKKAITGKVNFSFSTGGPAIKESWPSEGFDIDEDQAFVLALDAEADEDSILSSVYCSIEGINERVGVKILRGETREKIMAARHMRRFKDMPVVVLQCSQKFPNKSQVALVWGKGVKSFSGVETLEDQKLNFKTRERFTAKFSCDRENARADCIPILPMRLNFSSPVAWDIAKKITLKGHDKVYKPVKSARNRYEDEGEDVEEEVVPEDGNFVGSIIFKGPFPENSSFVISLPKGIRDDAGRSPANADIFPLTVKTDAYPPLAKFSARFGIIELKGDGTLPVTLRNLEPEVKTRMLTVEERKTGLVDKAKEGLLDKTVKLGEAVSPILPGSMKEKGKEYVEGLKGRLHKIRMDKEERIIDWLTLVAAAERKTSVLEGEKESKEFAVPKPEGSRAFEVVGIPLKKPGVYVVEMESRILGASLLGEQNPLYVPTTALVTNLSAHFKWGRESSLVWVTTLDKAEPVKDASVSIRDCNGKLIWKGNTGKDGLAMIKTALPSWQDLPRCSGEINYQEASHALEGINGGLFIFAKTHDDLTFVHTSWDKGIEPWRYNLEREARVGPIIAHTILDRSLVRAGETVHMKHIIRKHTMSGFATVNDPELPKTALIYHIGSDQRYEFPMKWDGKGISETAWKIPQEAKLGNYVIVLSKKTPQEQIKHRTSVGGYEEGDENYFRPDGLMSGSLRVEEFRVPLMKGIIQPPKERLVNASETDVDLLVNYLSGGAAGNMPVKIRSQVQPKYFHFEDYDDFIFANGDVKEGITRRSGYEAEGEQAKKEEHKVQTTEQMLDKAGSARAKITGLPKVDTPHDIVTELEFKDPNGEIQTVSTRMPLYPSKILLGIKPDSWAASKESFKFHVAALDIEGKPAPDVIVKVDLLQRKFYSHRKRLVGGFYSYEHVTEIKNKGLICEGATDAKGLLICESKSPVSGNVTIRAVARDDSGNRSVVHHDVWIVGKGEWWFDVSDSDRIDLLPEKKRYEPGETAKFQVRAPFRHATALVSVEREGIIETSIKKLSGKNPVIEVPVKGNYSPNVFVSVLCVRGRVENVKPTALVDLGKPAYKLGIAEINVGWRSHELRVKVSTDKSAYKIRDKVTTKINVRRADGKLPPKGSEVAIAAVDEGLLELMPNKSWKLLDAMMGKRGYEVTTSTAQMQVVGKRHYGLKALPQGGGGGRQVTRELFDTLLFWKARVALNEKGEASVEIPLNDSLTSFRIVAVASGGSGLFGTGEATVRTTQDLMLLSGLPQMVREGDKFRAGFTVRNASGRKMEVMITARITDSENKELAEITESINPGEAREIGWEIHVPYGIERLNYEVTAKEKDGEARDSLKVKQKVAEAIQVRTFQATISQLEKPVNVAVEKPNDAISGKGGINISVRPKLSNGLGAVTWYMKRYPYTCMEQKISRAIALKDETLWKNVLTELPAHLDSDGLLKYFPTMLQGSEILTSYMIAISNEAGWEIPEAYKNKMEEGLRKFVEGRIIRRSELPTADLSIRKLTAVEALARSGKAEAKLLDSIAIEPNLWPTSAVIDWLNILMRIKEIPGREKKLKEAEQILRSRLNFQGTTMGFSTEKTDCLWWLMVSCDLNAVKTMLTFMEFDNWKEDMPRLVRGAIDRQWKGIWSTTIANAWGVLALEKFSKKFEAEKVSGITSAELDKKKRTIDWKEFPKGNDIMFGWPKGKESLNFSHQGRGKPWVTLQSLAAIPLKDALLNGYKIKKTLIPVEQKHKGKWSRGDIVRVRLELEAQADMTWVVVNDPVPAGSNILGTGLGRDSQILTRNEENKGWVWPSFEERSFEAFKAYYEYVPKGTWTVEYTVRLNNEGMFHLPPTRVEALYSPEMFGEMPNAKMEVDP